MANLDRHESVLKIGKSRVFSEKFKKDTVKSIEAGSHSVLEVSRLYGVTRSAVYKWIYKYSILHQSGHRQIIEPMSSTKKVRELQDTIRELQRIIGSKQVRIDYLEKLIEITEKDEGIDIKKKGSRPRSGSGRTGRG